MQTETQHRNREASRKGQTLVEFAITLPVLLVLMFGIIEFGRIFQAWISIQNSAREAVRYASTNEYMARYDDLINLQRVSDPASMIPCVFDEDRKGGLVTVDPVQGGSGITVDTYDGAGAADARNTERLFATWYQGRDCDPFNEADQNLRRDLLRIASIYETAYWSSVGREDFPALPIQRVGIQDIGAGVSATPTEEEKRQAEEDLLDFIYSVWNPNYPQFDPPEFGTIAGQSAFPDTEEDLRGYFSVMMCSTRPFLYENSDPIFDSYPAFNGQRFITVIDPDPTDTSVPDELKSVVLGTDVTSGTDVPGCFLNELPVGQGVPGIDYTENRAVRWLDPGSGGNRVTVVVSYFHPLVTPLGLAEFVPIHARRSAIVEDFKGAGAAAAFNPLDSAAAGGGDAAIVPSEEAEEEDEPPPPPTETFTPTVTITPQPRETLAPRTFDCNAVTLVEADFNENLTEADRKIGFQPGRVVFRIRNANSERAFLDAVDLNWASADYLSGVDADPVPNYPGMYFSEFILDGISHWGGADYTPSTDTTDPTDGTAFETAVYEIPAETTVTWSAKFVNGPNFLNDELPRGAFSNTRFVIRDPVTNTQCPLGTIVFDSITQTLDDDTDDEDDEEITDCASEFVTFDASASPFRDFGWVQLVITNNHPSAPAPISDFNVNWGRWLDRDETGNVLLQGVYVGGSSPPSGVQIWRSSDPAGQPLGIVREGTSVFDDPGEYNPVTRADGAWVLATNDLRIPPGASRNFWLDLNGGNAATDGRNMKIFDFNGTEVVIDCPTDGSGGGGGGGDTPTGVVGIEDEPTPQATPTVELNDRPQANNDRYDGSSGFNGLIVHTVDSSRGILLNDTDCEDDTPGRGSQGGAKIDPPCSDDTNPSTFNGNGDSVSVDNCKNGSGCRTKLGGRVLIGDDGSFRYDPTGSTTLTCETTGTVTDEVNYRIRDARGATDTATIFLQIDVGSGLNRPPDPVNSSSNPQTYTYDMRTNSNPISSAQPENDTFMGLFDDPDNDEFNITFSENYNGLTVNNSDGTWSFNPWDNSSLVNLTAGNTRTIDITITVSDGDPNCGEATTTVRFVVTGQAEEETEEVTTEPPSDDGDVDFGGGGTGG